MARDRYSLADRQEIASIKAGNDIPNGIPCTKSKGNSEAKRRSTQNKASHNSDHPGVNLQLADCHHGDEKDNQN